MAEYLSPGVYVEEVDNAPRTITGVGTSTAGFVGLAEKGPAFGAPVFIPNFAEFTRVFGACLNEFTFGEFRYLANSVEQFFINGGTRCFVARVVPDGAKCASISAGGTTFTAANEGKWGNRIQITLTTQMRKKIQFVKATDAGFVAKNVSALREGDIVFANGQYNRVATIFDNVVTFAVPFEGNIVDDALLPQTVVYLVTTDVTVRYNSEKETYTDVTFDPLSPSYIGLRMGRSELVKVECKPLDEIMNPVSAILGEGIESGILTLTGGDDGKLASVNAATFIGKDNGPGQRTGIQSFIENAVVSMIAIPGVTIPEVEAALIAHCETQQNRVAVLDMPKEYTKVNELVEYRSMFDSTYAAMYHPWIMNLDRSTNKTGLLPPSGAIMGVYSRTDIARGVHKAPANETVFATGLGVNYTKDEQDLLNPEGINLIRSIPGQGIRVWGARTISANTSFRYINVRRLFIYIEQSIKNSTNWVVFEPNDESLWSRLYMTVDSFLESCMRAGMFASADPGSAYFVDIGPNTMSRDDIDAGRLICNVGIAPSKPAEFVIFKVSQFTAEAGSTEE